MSAEENKALVQRRFEEIDNQQNLAVIDELVASDDVRHDPCVPADPQQGREAFRQRATPFASAADGCPTGMTGGWWQRRCLSTPSSGS
jgi:hypothetical protein